MKIDNKKLEIAYQHCKIITKTYAKSFYFSSYFLPQDKKNSAYAVYAFCRYMDDLVDRSVFISGSPEDQKSKIIEAINTWKNDLRSVYAGDFIDNPIMIAWKDTLSKYHIPMELPNELIDGVFMDLTIKRYEDFEQLRNYCYKVASVVGLMTIEIFGYDNKEAFEYAIDLGIGMQLTNILRDIREDAEKNRIYIPLNELKEFNYSEDDLLNFRMNKNFVEMMKYQISRAEKFYKRADTGIKMLNRDSRLTVGLMSNNYKKILTEIKNNNFDVFSKRNYVPLHKKILNIPEIYLKYRFI